MKDLKKIKRKLEKENNNLKNNNTSLLEKSDQLERNLINAYSDIHMAEIIGKLMDNYVKASVNKNVQLLNAKETTLKLLKQKLDTETYKGLEKITLEYLYEYCEEDFSNDSDFTSLYGYKMFIARKIDPILKHFYKEKYKEK